MMLMLRKISNLIPKRTSEENEWVWRRLEKMDLSLTLEGVLVDSADPKRGQKGACASVHENARSALEMVSLIS